MRACSNRNLNPAEQRILVMQLARLGDFLQSTPLLAALRAAHPGAGITAMVSPAQAPLARQCPHVDQVAVVKPTEMQAVGNDELPAAQRAALVHDLEKRLARLNPSHIYNLNMSAVSASIAGAWPGAALIGWHGAPGGHGLIGEPWFGYMINMVADRRLTRAHLADLLASLADPPGPPAARLQYVCDPRHRQRADALLPPGEPRLVALQLGTNSPLRRWPVAQFATLASGLAAAGFRPILVGTSAESPLAGRLLDMAGPQAATVLNLMGRTDVPTLAAILERCALVVSGDTGTLHLATAVGAPTLSLYMGPAQVHETGPYGAGHLIMQARDHCGPCQEQTPQCGGKAPCRGLLRAEQVLEPALALLAGADAALAASRIRPPEGVVLWESVLDRYGQRYRPLAPLPATAPEALALALREAGRVLSRSAYAPDATELRSELTAEYLPPSGDEARNIAGYARAAQALALAADSGDGEAARAALSDHAELSPLGPLPGYSPPRRAAACRAAAMVLDLAASHCGGKD